MSRFRSHLRRRRRGKTGDLNEIRRAVEEMESTSKEIGSQESLWGRQNQGLCCLTGGCLQQAVQPRLGFAGNWKDCEPGQ